MKRWMFSGLMIILCLGFSLRVFSQELDFKILGAEVLEVRLKDNPHTMRVVTQLKYKRGKAVEEDLTIDPQCTFYKGDEKPKTIAILKPEDMVEITYTVSKGIKIAFNIIVLPEEEVVE
ncbi:MAG: hypothetical protein KAJ14_04875 [Candidatus Omnitrophica bacterium]|nr:hypothetical protein [Candidatus Omnitrophota bacterium]MCK5287432.1 hypothetical protein [Candidatus Omnitrophota bacterium]MCK5492426.1 hypothetical protein [Candidatus Omnitrophota bacterium]